VWPPIDTWGRDVLVFPVTGSTSTRRRTPTPRIYSAMLGSTHQISLPKSLLKSLLLPPSYQGQLMGSNCIRLYLASRINLDRKRSAEQNPRKESISFNLQNGESCSSLHHSQGSFAERLENKCAHSIKLCNSLDNCDWPPFQAIQATGRAPHVFPNDCSQCEIEETPQIKKTDFGNPAPKAFSDLGI